MAKMKKAQTTITLIFWVIVFLIVFIMFGAQFMGYWSTQAVTSNNLTGIEAFLLNNLLLWFILIVLVFIIAYAWGNN